MANDLTARVRARITPANAALLDVRARAMGVTKSRVVNNALERLDTIIRHNHRSARDANLQSESFSLFLHFFFTMAPQFSGVDSDTRAARGVALMNQYIDKLGAKMKSGGKTFKHALSDVLISDEDFFRMDELKLLQGLQSKRLAHVRNAAHSYGAGDCRSS